MVSQERLGAQKDKWFVMFIVRDGKLALNRCTGDVLFVEIQKCVKTHGEEREWVAENIWRTICSLSRGIPLPYAARFNFAVVRER